MSTYGRDITCELCGHADANVRTGLACFRDDGRFERIARCSDHQRCRDRVEASGGEWLLSDLTERRVAR